MKKLITLVVAGCMVLGSLATAAAVDVKVTGQWYFHYGYYSNQTMVEKKDSGTHADRTVARQRIRTQIQFIADENLSALLNMETNLDWGKRSDSKGIGIGGNMGGGSGGGGGIDADQATFFIKRAHLDWTLPNTQTKIRMGMQGLSMPTVAFGNPVLNADVAGVMVSSQFTPEVGLTAFWIRPYDEGWGTSDQTSGANSLDEMDVFGFTLPIKTDVVRVSPWAALALIGKDSGFYTGDRRTRNFLDHGNFKRNPVNGDIDSDTYAWWGGVAFELPVIDPFFVKIDAMMGGLDTGDSDYDTFGYLIAANMGYKFSFGSLSAIGWYSSGDKDIDDRGTMPIISDDGGTFAPTQVGLAGGRNRNLDSQLSTNGLGMWGIGVKLADVSFVDNLKHSVTALYMGGTNEGDSTVSRRNTRSGTSPLSGAYYMSSDRLYEINLQNSYKAAENLTLTLDFAYLWLDLGDHWDHKDDTTGNFATMIGVEYAF